jgi:predicted dithiol-disulfide oxidoreductase (DUF899 family)
VELQSRYTDIQAQGLGLVVITYDSLETLSTFSEARGIRFPMLSDEGSAVIQEYDLLNREQQPGRRTYGIPYPGTFILNTEGRVTARFFEQAYQERFTVSSIMVALKDAVDGTDRNATRLTTDHLEALVYATDGTVAPGNRFSLVVDVTPKGNMHVYAPGNHTYQVISLRIDTPDFVRAHDVTYPEPQIYHFEPLDEQPFTLVQEVTIPMSREIGALAAEPNATLTIEGALEYQACDDAICYTPVELPVSWTFDWRPLVR